MTRILVAWCLVSMLGAAEVVVERLPTGAVQPQVVCEASGVVHLVCLRGRSAGTDVWYAQRPASAVAFPELERVNSIPESAIATGTVRGPHAALGRAGRLHVCWNAADGKGLWYTSRDPLSGGFQAQRNLMRLTSGLDGGSGIAADASGHVLAAWHTHIPGAAANEGGRGVFLTASADDGATFAAEARACDQDTGACGCCALALGLDAAGRTSLLFRGAMDSGRERDCVLLTAPRLGEPFHLRDLHPWAINACPMSTACIAAAPTGQLLAWETQGQIYTAQLTDHSGALSPPRAVPGAGGTRKHPVVAWNAQHELLVVWTEGTGWERGGNIAWQCYDQSGTAQGELGHAEQLPVWGTAAAWADATGTFHIIY